MKLDLSNEALVAAGFKLTRTFNGVWEKENLKFNQVHGVLILKASETQTRIWRNIKNAKEFATLVSKAPILVTLANLDKECNQFYIANKVIPRVISIPMSWQNLYTLLHNKNFTVNFRGEKIPVTFNPRSNEIQLL